MDSRKSKAGCAAILSAVLRPRRLHGAYPAAILSLLLISLPAYADLSFSGDIDPSNPAEWTHETTAYVGKTRDGELTINGGSEVIDLYGYVGFESGAVGSVSVADAGSSWTNESNLWVGNYGEGRLSITGGGVVSNAIGTIGRYAGSTGLVTVDGDSSAWSVSEYLPVGNHGDGTLAITNGGIVINTQSAYIGRYTGSVGSVSVDGFNSTWETGGDLTIGREGEGRLLISNSGSVSSTDSYIGSRPDSIGSVIVDGAGSSWANSSDLYVGGNSSTARGTGTLTVRNGGHVTSGGVLTIWSGGTLNLEGGSITTHSLKIVDIANLNLSSGVLTVDGGLLTLYTDEFLLDGVDFDLRMVNGATSETSVPLRMLSGALEVSSGSSFASAAGFIGYGPGSSGIVTIEGPGSSWITYRSPVPDPWESDLYVGHGGEGTLEVTDGGLVSNATGYIGYVSGSNGSVRVGGAMASWTNDDGLYVGRAGTAHLEIHDAGNVSSKAGYIGYHLGSQGSVAVHGAESEWVTEDELVVGYNGVGRLAITQGGEVSNTYGHIGHDPQSEGTVTVVGDGSTWSNTNDLYIGNHGEGTLAVSNGGAVSNFLGIIGLHSGSMGAVSVDGHGSTWSNSDTLVMGFLGEGHLAITNGGVVNSSGAFLDLSSKAAVDGVGSAWTVDGTLNLGYLSTGTLKITGGGLVSVASGQLDVLSVDSLGNGASHIDMATGGMLALHQEDGVPTTQVLALMADTIRYWDETRNAWAPLAEAAFGVDYTLEQPDDGDFAGYTLLTVGEAPALPGDFNDDGVVDAADYVVWRDHRGNQGISLPNDTFRGTIGDHQLKLWKTHYGETLGSESRFAVPEPASALLCLALCGWGVRLPRFQPT